MARKDPKYVRSVPWNEAGESTGGAPRIPEGQYRLKCVKAEWDESENGNEMISWVFKGLEGKAKGKTFYFHTVTAPQALWKLRDTCAALGFEVPDEADDLDVRELIDLEGIADIADDIYKGKTRSKIEGFIEEGGKKEEEEEEETTSHSKANGKGKGKVVKVSEDEVKDMSEDELEDLVSKYKLDVDLSDFKILRKKIAAVTSALDEGGLLEA